MRAYKSSGFTLIELIVVVVIVAILATWAVPNFAQLAARNALDRQVDRFWQAASAARLEAAERRARVHLCPSLDGNQCAKDWLGTLILFEDANNDGQHQPSERLIRRFASIGDRIDIQSNGSLADGFSYQPDGFATEIGSFWFCHSNLDAKSIVISHGRLRQATGEENSCQPQQP